MGGDPSAPVSRRHDAVLAVVALAGVLSVAAALDATRALSRPVPAVVGVAGALAIELAMAAYPDVSRRLWRRRDVRAGSVVGVVVAGLAGASGASDWVLGALAWGLLTYFALLGLVVSGLLAGPETWFREN